MHPARPEHVTGEGGREMFPQHAPRADYGYSVPAGSSREK